MKQVPYHGNPGGSACALACYTMAAQYLLPDENITFKELGKLADFREGYVVWAFPVWRWLMDHGVRINNFDISDMKVWAEQGIKGLQTTVSKKEFDYYQKYTYDLDAVTNQVKFAYNHPNFNYTQKRVTWSDIKSEFQKPGICDVTLDGRKLHRTEGFTVHRVVLIDITDHEVVFHDPVKDNSGAYRREPTQHFRAALDSLSGCELTRYYL